jgi:hypothetical protein
MKRVPDWAVIAEICFCSTFVLLESWAAVTLTGLFSLWFITKNAMEAKL